MDSETRQTIGSKLKELRKSHNLMQVDIAASIDIKQATYSQYETGKRIPSAVVLFKIASFYGISVDDLLKLCIDHDDNIYFDAMDISVEGKEQKQFLAFIEKERYSALDKQEQRLLFYYAKLNELERNDVISYTIFKSLRKKYP